MNEQATASHAAKVAKTPRELTFLKKAQIVAGFDMDIIEGANAPVDYSGAFALASHVSGATKKQVLEFLHSEGITTLPDAANGNSRVKRTRISAEDFYKLEERYAIPLKKEEIQTVYRKFASADHKAEIFNGNSAFGIGFSRVIKLLRDNGVGATCTLVDAKASAGADQAENCTVRMTQAQFDDFSARFTDILKAEAARKSKYDAGVAERSAQAVASKA